MGTSLGRFVQRLARLAPAPVAIALLLAACAVHKSGQATSGSGADETPRSPCAGKAGRIVGSAGDVDLRCEGAPPRCEGALPLSVLNCTAEPIVIEQVAVLHEGQATLVTPAPVPLGFGESWTHSIQVSTEGERRVRFVVRHADGQGVIEVPFATARVTDPTRPSPPPPDAAPADGNVPGTDRATGA